jgi:protoporphyrinogen/coproporphyrinogen III oxidase
VLLRAFLGGAALRRLDSTSDAGLIPLVRRDVEDLLRIRDTPLFVSVARHPASMPHYTVGHLERAERVRTLARRWPGLAIAGNALGGVGLPDCVREGETAADDLLKSAVANPS